MNVGDMHCFVLCRVRTSELLDRRALILGRSFIVTALGADDFPPRFVPRLRHPLAILISMPIGVDVADIRLVKLGRVVVLVACAARLKGFVPRHVLTPANPRYEATPHRIKPLATA